MFKAVLGQNNRRRVHDQYAGIAINDDPVVLLDQLAGTACTDHRRDVHAARHDGGVRSFAAHIGRKPGKQALLELQHVGRRNVMCNQHQRHINRVVQQQALLRLLAAGPGLRHRLHGRCHAFHAPQNPFDDLLQVSFAFAQVLVFHVVKLARNTFVLRGQRPLGVVAPLGDPFFNPADELVVLQQHQVHVQQRRYFMRCVFGQVVLQAGDFVNHRIARHPDARNFQIGFVCLDKVMRDVSTA